MPEVALHVGGRVFRDWTAAEIVRSLTDLSGSFRLDYDDQVRVQSVLPRSDRASDLVAIEPGMEARVELDGELALLGWIDDVEFEVSGDQLRASLAGRDRTGDLVDCSAAPEGPVEYRGLTVLELARRLCAPFNIEVRAEVEVGPPLSDFALDVSEPVISALDKAAKQRALLITSDGVGGLVLTRAGARRAPEALSLPGNAVSLAARLTMRERFSDYYVKGQTRNGRGGAGRKSRTGPPLDGTVEPGTARADPGTATSSHSRRPVSTAGLDGSVEPGTAPAEPGTPVIDIEVTAKRLRRPARIQRAIVPAAGHARDPAVERWRPRVWIARTQSGDVPLQVLADWRMRLARGHTLQHTWTVPGFRAGDEDRLWRPNEIVSIELGDEPPRDLLIQGVTYRQDEGGSRSEIVTVPPEAYDQEPLPEGYRGKQGSALRLPRRGIASRGAR